jgi:hypothetical protein
MQIKELILGTALLGLGCGTATLGVESRPEAEQLGSVQHQLEQRLKEKFGEEARLQRVFGLGEEVVLGVALDEAVAETDLRSPLALAGYRHGSDALTVISTNAEYKEARLLSDSTALVTAAGELKVRAADGSERTLATDVKGEVVPAPAGALLFTTVGGVGNSAVMLTDASGALHVIADSDGVDDRPSISDDGVTVVFVSGRTGIASLWRTTLDGAPAVQLTNKDIVAGIERDGPPEGFVPPPVMADRLEWVSTDVVRYDAGDGEFWRVDVRTGAASREGAAP